MTDQYSTGADGCGDYSGDGSLRARKSGGAGKRRGGGGAGGMKFNRVVPAFLQGYSHMLVGGKVGAVGSLDGGQLAAAAAARTAAGMAAAESGAHNQPDSEEDDQLVREAIERAKQEEQAET